MSDGREGHGTQRAMMLIQQGRWSEAEQACRETLASDPEDPFLLHLLALAQHQQEDGDARALPTVDRAIALEPDAAAHHALRARILAALHRLDEAVASADEAIRLEPDSTDGHAARSWVHMRRHEWAKAETSAREALAIDPEDSDAAHLLTESLRLQGREAENREVLAERLARDPLNPDAHVSMGWRALQAGRRAEAEQHFLEALRLEPGGEAGREGLLEAFKARAPWYGAWLQLNLWAARFSRTNRWLVLVGLFLLVRFSRLLFPGPLAPIGYVLTALWVALVLWSHLASGTAKFFVLLDARARLALRRPERLEALAVGGCLFGGLLVALVGLAPAAGRIEMVGIGLMAASIPFAYTFTNDAPAGRILFGLFGTLAVIAGVAMSVQASPPGGLAFGLAVFAAIGVIGTTWLVNVRALRR